MKPTLKISVLGIVLLTGCVVADDAVRQLRLAQKAVQTARESRHLGKKADVIKKAEEALQHANEAHRKIQSAPDAPRSNELKRALQELEQVELEAHFIKLETQANNAVEASTTTIKTGGGELANASDADLKKLLGDFLCLNLEKVANEQQLPSDEDYREFLLDHAITRFVPVWEIKQKAKSIIEFAESTHKPGSSGELQARVRILQECNFRRGGTRPPS